MLLSERIKKRQGSLMIGMVPSIKDDELIELQILEMRVERFDEFLRLSYENENRLKQQIQVLIEAIFNNKILFLAADQRVIVDFISLHLDYINVSIARIFEVP